MKKSGVALVIVGFLWIGWKTAMFIEFSSVRWMWHAKELHSKQLPGSETIPTELATREMARLKSELDAHQRYVIIPATMMLVGGLLSAWNRKKPEPVIR